MVRGGGQAGASRSCVRVDAARLSAVDSRDGTLARWTIGTLCSACARRAWGLGPLFVIVVCDCDLCHCVSMRARMESGVSRPSGRLEAIHLFSHNHMKEDRLTKHNAQTRSRTHATRSWRTRNTHIYARARAEL
eukprot:7033565-Prymnesium_polylepis.1